MEVPATHTKQYYFKTAINLSFNKNKHSLWYTKKLNVGKMKLIAQKGQKCTFRPPPPPNNNFHGGRGGGATCG